MAVKSLPHCVVLVLAATSVAMAAGTSDTPLTISTCSSTPMTVRNESGAYAWVLAGSDAIVTQIGWEAFLQTGFRLQTTTQLGNLPGEWQMQLRSLPRTKSLFVCLNHTNTEGSGNVGVKAVALLVKGNYSVAMKEIRPCARGGPHPHPHPGPPGPGHRGPHPPPPPGPPGHKGHHPPPHPGPPGHDIPPPPPPGPPGRMEFEELDEELRCTQYWSLRSPALTVFPDSVDDFAVAFDIHANILDVQQTTQSNTCNVPTILTLMPSTSSP